MRTHTPIRVIDTAPRPTHTTTTTATRTLTAAGDGFERYSVTHAWACTCGAAGEGPHGAFRHAWGGLVEPTGVIAHAEVLSVVR